MKRVTLSVSSLIVLVGSLCGLAEAQGGCGQISIDEGDIICRDDAETQQDHSCGGTGDPRTTAVRGLASAAAPIIVRRM